MARSAYFRPGRPGAPLRNVEYYTGRSLSLMIIRSFAILGAVLAQSVTSFVVGQQRPHSLFTGALRTEDASVHSVHLAPAEERMRIVALRPTSTDGGIDLSLPLDIELFDDVRYSVQLRRETLPVLGGLEVWKGRVADDRFAHLPHYRNAVFVLNTTTGRLVANIGTDKGFFQVLPTAQAGEYRVRACKRFGNERCGPEPANATELDGALRGTLLGCDSLCDETDADGRYVIDVLAGYSEEAAAVAGDLAAHAQANIETVNMGLANSLVDVVYMRLVGTATTPENPGIITSVLDDAWTWFAPEVEALAPDMIAVFQTPTNAPGSAGGWGSMPGRTSVNGVEWPTVFRHEAGHNAGGNHCYPDNDNYRNGHDNGHWRTHLCGNDVNFYSNPLINDDQGTPIGDVDQADMARVWTEMAPTMARWAMHRVPYHEGDVCVDQTCLPSHWGDPIEYIDHVVFNTIDHLQDDPGWNCPWVPGYSDHTALSTSLAAGSVHDLFVSSTASWEESTMRAWIDWNGDGILGAAEQVMDLAGIGPWTQPVSVPPDAVQEPVRLRIRLQYGLDGNAGPCDGSGYSSGETEDYTVNITEGINTGIGGTTAATAAGLALLPNPATGSVTLLTGGLAPGAVRVTFINAAGQRVQAMDRLVRTPTDRLTLDVAALPAGLYACEMRHAAQGVRLARMVKE